MTVRSFDEVIYHDQRCHVEQVWDDAQGHDWALIRPVETMESGVYIVDQADVQPLPPTAY
jgi:hypothetical protein